MAHAFKIDVAHQAAIGQAVDAHVNHHSAGTHHLFCNEVGTAGGHHQNVRQNGELGQVTGLGVANTHGGVLLHEHQRHGLAHNVAGAHHHHVLPLDTNVLELQHFLHPKRGTRRKYGVAQHQATHVVEVKTVHILVDGDGSQHPAHIKMLGQRQLHQNAVHCGVGVEALNFCFYDSIGHTGLEGVHRRAQAHLRASLDLVGHIDFGGRIVAHNDHRQAWRDAPGLE